MARKETVNTFTNGLISDLNPINTPNTVLTDCLNGTLITYDGNEYSLQNDKGNFPLKDCKLPENYIPVGVKEYGDILYIVSYNPITKHVQIGSYPSPETIFDEFDIQGNDSTASTYDNNLKYEDIASLWDDLAKLTPRTERNGGGYNYSDLIENLEKLKLFYGPVPENYKLNPGDKYKVSITNGDNNNPQTIDNLDLGTFEGIEFYIFDENRKPYDITKNIEINTQNHVYTSWKVPGYMATKLRFAQVDDFKVNVRKIIVPTYHTANSSAIKELSLNFQYFISDYLYNDHISDIIRNNRLKILIQVSKQTGYLGSAIETINGTLDLKNGTICYYLNWTLPNSGTGSYSFESNDVVTLTITPFVELNSKRVFYDKFQRTLTFDLAQKGDVNDFEIGEGLWRYTVDNQLTLYFDTSGIQETSVMSQDVELQYKLTRISNNTDIGGWNTVYDWNVIGDTVLKIDFDAWTGLLDATKVYAEDYYTISFRFIDPENQNQPLRNDLITRNILATELLNGNPSKRYDKIYFNEWINNYSNHIDNKFVVVNATVDQNNQTTFIEHDKYYNIWMSDGKINAYPTFKSITDDDGIDITTNPDPEFVITGGINFNTTVSYTSDLKLPTGPLWQNLTANINYTDSSQKQINSTTGKVNNPQQVPEEHQINRLEKKLKYRLRDSSLIERLFNFTETSLDIPQEEEIILEANGIYESKITGLPEPDLELKLFGNTYKMTTDTSSYFEKVSTQLLNKLNEYDILFITIKMDRQKIGDNGPNYNTLRFKTGWRHFTTGDNIYACASRNTGSETYFAVLKIKDSASNKFKLLFVPIGNTALTPSGANWGLDGNGDWDNVVTSANSRTVNYNLFNTWSRNIKHLKGDGVEVIGRFYKAVEKKTDNNTKVIYITTTPHLSFDSWTYLNKNMFLENERSTISNNDNFFKTKSDSEQISLLSGIYFDTQTSELVYNGSTTELDNLIEEEKTAISERNEQVEDEIENASDPTNYLNHYDDPNLDLFIDITDPDANSVDYRSLLIKFLNKELTCNTPVMFVISDHFNPAGDWVNGLYTQHNYIGTIEVGLVINPTS